MSPADDYREDMIIGRLSDKDIDELLSGVTPESKELLALANFVDALRAEGDRPLEAEVVGRYAAEAAAIVRLDQPARHQVGAGSVAPRPRRRLTTSVATAVASLLFAGSLTGVAVAANGAAPGDLLYRVDLALERVGVGAGGAAERLQEAGALAASGRAADALAHAAAAIGEVVDAEESSSSADALMTAAESVRTSGDEASEEVREKVARLLAFLENTGGVDGQEVAEMAREIGGPPQGGPPVDTPDDPGTGQDSPAPDGGGGPPDGMPPSSVPPPPPASPTRPVTGG